MESKPSSAATGTSGESRREEGEEEVDTGAVAAVAAGDTKTSKQAEGVSKGGENDKKEGTTTTPASAAEKKPEPEPSFSMLSNPARVLTQQVSSTSPTIISVFL